MPTLRLSPALRGEYQLLFDTCELRREHAGEVEAVSQRVLEQQARYAQVEAMTGVPWHFIAVVHQMESGGRFDRHLHNGDPLTARTRQVPRGRPRVGTPPFAWELSAADALAMHGLSGGTDWGLASLLYELERYNGFGYRLYHPEVRSPYLWSFTSHYRSGKYVADGRWSHSARSAQSGAAALLRRLVEQGHVALADQPPPAAHAPPLVVAHARRMPGAPATRAAACALQRWLNGFAGIFVKVDGWPGARTSAAWRQVTGHYLPGDPRAGAARAEQTRTRRARPRRAEPAA